MDKLNIVINGVTLTAAQTMTIHVALQSFAMDLSSKKNPLGKDAQAKSLAKGYLHQIDSITALYMPSK